MKLGILSSGNLGKDTLEKIILNFTVVFVLTDSNSHGVLSLCKENKIPCFKGNPRNGIGYDFIKKIEVDIIVSINYLFLIEKDIIQHSKQLTFNIHGSLLPKYRGRSPHVWAIINNEKVTGITAHVIDEGCDTGDIISQIKIACDDAEVPVPNIFTEFGSFTVGESGGAVYQVLYQKQQNDREKWNMIDSSFITTLPDTWAINKRFVMLAINRWNDTYERVLLGGMTCDSDDYYNSEQNMNAVYLPKYNKEKPLYIGFFNTGAYQETIGGFGGLHHCLIPQPKHILIDRDENGILATEVFSEEQKAEDIMGILGYKKK